MAQNWGIEKKEIILCNIFSEKALRTPLKGKKMSWEQEFTFETDLKDFPKGPKWSSTNTQ